MKKPDHGSQNLFWIECLAAFVAICFAAYYLYVAYKRITYAYDLDFIEDNMLMQAIQVALGRPVYVAPNADFVPQVYMPLFTTIGGWLFKIFPTSYLPLRLLSFGSTICSAVTIFLVSRRLSGGLFLALACCGLFLAGYRTTGGWYELARVDALYVALTLAGAALLAARDDSNFKPALAGGLLALAFLTKQNGLFFAIVAAIYLAINSRRRALWFISAFLLFSLPPLLYWEYSSAGWFSTYVFKIALLSPIEFSRVTSTLKDDLFGSMVGLTLAAAIAFVALFQRGRWQGIRAEPWAWFIGAALFIGISGRASVGGNRNNLMPAYAFLCIGPALAAREMRLWAGMPQIRTRVALAAVLLFQFALCAFVPKYPFRFVPTAAMSTAGDRLIQRIAHIDGPVLVMMHPFYAMLASKEASVDIQMLWHARLRGELPLPPDLVSRIENRYYSAIISDESSFEIEPALLQLISQNYLLAQDLDQFKSPATTSGVPVHPRIIYVRKPPA